MFTFRLLKSLNTQTDEGLDSQSDICEKLAIVGAIVVVVGVALEIAVVICNPPYGLPLQRIGSLFADVFIALGIIAEVSFGTRESSCQSELRRRSNQRLAVAVAQAGEAHERASAADKKAADLELQALQLRVQLGPREINKDQYDVLLSLKDKVASIGVTSYADSESVAFARQFVEAFRRAGIDAKLYDQRIGMSWTGIFIVVPRPLLDYASDPVFATFKRAGIPAGCGPRDFTPMADLPKDIPIVMVGEKRGLPHSWPAYVHTLPPPEG